MSALTLFAVLLAAYYLTRARWSHALCRRCRGTGQLPAPLGRRWRTCPRCAGTGDRTHTHR